MNSGRRAHDTIGPEPLTLAAPELPLRVEFRWCGDRFVQSFLLDDVEVGRSVESEADEIWPTSPPIQQLSLEEIDGRQVALGVGAAGQSHWSISVETYRCDQRMGLKFDLACRCHSDPGRLASTYVLDDRLRVEPLSSSILQQTDSDQVIQPPVSSGQTTHQWSYLITKRHPIDSNEITQSP